MSFWLEPELQRYFDIDATGLPPPMRQEAPNPLQASPLFPSGNSAKSANYLAELKEKVTAALADDPALSFLLRLDNVLDSRDGVITCVATVRRNVHYQELQYLQRFKQVAEPAIRIPTNKEQMLQCLDPRTLRCGQQVLLKVHARAHPAEPLQLLREWAILRAVQDPSAFPRPYLFGCLGNDCWRVVSENKNDDRQLVLHRQHFLLCQYVEDSLQRVINGNRASVKCLDSPAAVRLCRDMLNKVGQLHNSGWSHGCLQPSSFELLGSDEMLLADFASAEPLTRNCLIYRGERERSLVYGAVRFSPNVKLEAPYADLESLVYIACSLMSPKHLPWESVDSALPNEAAVSAHKQAVWKFVDEHSATNSESAEDLWRQWQLNEVFNCSSAAQVGELPAFRLASGILQAYREKVDGELPNCSALLDTLRS
ncbi:hypothetical protein BOX15_Mlig027668g1 [Macrostomum lignano]|uniref:Uncharacterized protein n=2 Tax=Macrostomum lignano TaxID=282301 RepID=A0A267GRS8_9PLAT|nr:hypothetical protein BOX15_Mlig027668g2 [Macrostomum lignano]PAA88713.1 hypothetical protein BOX15_Mlig027668g1 [Macrostomum lignano]